LIFLKDKNKESYKKYVYTYHSFIYTGKCLEQLHFDMNGVCIFKTGPYSYWWLFEWWNCNML